MLGEGLTEISNGSVGATEQKFNINFSNARRRFWLSSHYNHDGCYLFVEGKEIYNFKANNKNVNFPTQILLGSISHEINHINSREVYLIFQSITMSLTNLTY